MVRAYRPRGEQLFGDPEPGGAQEAPPRDPDPEGRRARGSTPTRPGARKATRVSARVRERDVHAIKAGGSASVGRYEEWPADGFVMEHERVPMVPEGRSPPRPPSQPCGVSPRADGPRAAAAAGMRRGPATPAGTRPSCAETAISGTSSCRSTFSTCGTSESVAASAAGRLSMGAGTSPFETDGASPPFPGRALPEGGLEDQSQLLLDQPILRVVTRGSRPMTPPGRRGMLPGRGGPGGHDVAAHDLSRLRTRWIRSSPSPGEACRGRQQQPSGLKEGVPGPLDFRSAGARLRPGPKYRTPGCGPCQASVPGSRDECPWISWKRPPGNRGTGTNPSTDTPGPSPGPERRRTAGSTPRVSAPPASYTQQPAEVVHLEPAIPERIRQHGPRPGAGGVDLRCSRDARTRITTSSPSRTNKRPVEGARPQEVGPPVRSESGQRPPWAMASMAITPGSQGRALCRHAHGGRDPALEGQAAPSATSSGARGPHRPDAPPGNGPAAAGVGP